MGSCCNPHRQRQRRVDTRNQYSGSPQRNELWESDMGRVCVMVVYYPVMSQRGQCYPGKGFADPYIPKLSEVAFVREQTAFSCVQLWSPDYGRTDSVRVSALRPWKAHSTVCCPHWWGCRWEYACPLDSTLTALSAAFSRQWEQTAAPGLCIYHSLHHERKFQQIKTSLLEHSLRCHSSSGLGPLPGPPGVPKWPDQ